MATGRGIMGKPGPSPARKLRSGYGAQGGDCAAGVQQGSCGAAAIGFGEFEMLIQRFDSLHAGILNLAQSYLLKRPPGNLCGASYRFQVAVLQRRNYIIVH